MRFRAHFMLAAKDLDLESAYDLTGNQSRLRSKLPHNSS